MNEAWWRVLKGDPIPFSLEPPEDPIHLGIVGSRNLPDYDAFKEKADEWVAQNGQPHSIISGGPRGADALRLITLKKTWRRGCDGQD